MLFIIFPQYDIKKTYDMFTELSARNDDVNTYLDCNTDQIIAPITILPAFLEKLHGTSR